MLLVTLNLAQLFRLRDCYDMILAIRDDVVIQALRDDVLDEIRWIDRGNGLT